LVVQGGKNESFFASIYQPEGPQFVVIESFQTVS
jgi:hypothetical protein